MGILIVSMSRREYRICSKSFQFQEVLVENFPINFNDTPAFAPSLPFACGLGVDEGRMSWPLSMAIHTLLAINRFALNKNMHLPFSFF